MRKKLIQHIKKFQTGRRCLIYRKSVIQLTNFMSFCSIEHEKSVMEFFFLKINRRTNKTLWKKSRQMHFEMKGQGVIDSFLEWGYKNNWCKIKIFTIQDTPPSLDYKFFPGKIISFNSIHFLHYTIRYCFIIMGMWKGTNIKSFILSIYDAWNCKVQIIYTASYLLLYFSSRYLKNDFYHFRHLN